MTLFLVLIQFLICANVLSANISPNPGHSLTMEEIIFQSRTKEGRQFNKDFAGFEDGFTSPDGTAFWLGLKALHYITRNSNWNMVSNFQEKKTGKWFWTELSNFKVGAPPGYKLTFDQRVGGTYDITGKYWKYHDKMLFTTLDKDQDKNGGNCAIFSWGGWWSNSCDYQNPNGVLARHNSKGTIIYANVTSLRLVKRPTSNMAAKPVCPKQSKDDIFHAIANDDTFTFQSRKKLDVSFANKSFDEYENGFGLMGRTDYWVGLKKLHNYTKTMECNLVAFFQVAKTNNWLWIEISNFKVGAGPEFTLSIGDRVDGNFDENLEMWKYHNNSAFSTVERDQDDFLNGNCAENMGQGGWWYSACYRINPNAQKARLESGSKPNIESNEMSLIFHNKTTGAQEVLLISASILKIKEIK